MPLSEPGAVVLTVIENAGNEAVVEPSDPLMTILAKVPAAVGVPLKVPVAVLKLAQDGRFWIL